MVTRWPNRDEREAVEIGRFIAAYSRLPGCVQLEVVQKRDKPDHIVRDVRTGQEYGVELTSVYLDDRSVPDVHMRDEAISVWIPDDAAELEKYRSRLAGAVLDKICKARHGYDLSRPLILGVYVNEYISIYMPALRFRHSSSDTMASSTRWRRSVRSCSGIFRMAECSVLSQAPAPTANSAVDRTAGSPSLAAGHRGR
jgi:hypothetical protein